MWGPVTRGTYRVQSNAFDHRTRSIVPYPGGQLYSEEDDRLPHTLLPVVQVSASTHARIPVAGGCLVLRSLWNHHAAHAIAERHALHARVQMPVLLAKLLRIDLEHAGSDIVRLV